MGKIAKEALSPPLSLSQNDYSHGGAESAAYANKNLHKYVLSELEERGAGKVHFVIILQMFILIVCPARLW